MPQPAVDDFERSATVVSLQRMSTEDGPGLRTTVFLKGCSLECAWCHNPEAMSRTAELVWHDWKCIGAAGCVAVCPEKAVRRNTGVVEIDFERCTFCGRCVEECPTTALELIGSRWQLDDLLAEMVRDRSYFEASGGGVTVSGGEPGLQPGFVGAFAGYRRAAGARVGVLDIDWVYNSMPPKQGQIFPPPIDLRQRVAY